MVNIGYSSSNTISNYSIDEVGQSEPLFSLMAQSITDLVASGAIELLLTWAYAMKIIELFYWNPCADFSHLNPWVTQSRSVRLLVLEISNGNETLSGGIQLTADRGKFHIL